MKNYPKVSIIILNWNGLKDTIECLDSLKKITYPNYEVVVVDNGSEGNDAGILEEQYKNYIKVIGNKENLGFAGGNNVGIREVLKKGESEYILLLNNDTVVDSNFLDKLIETAESGPRIGIVGPKIYFYDDSNLIYTAGGKITHHPFKGIQIPQRGQQEIDVGKFNTLEKVDWIDGCCMLVRCEAIKDVGLLNEDYFLYWDVVEWAMEMDKKGWICYYTPQSVLFHKISRTISKNKNRQWYYYVKDTLNFQSRHLRNRFWLTYYPLRLIKDLIIDPASAIRDKNFIKSRVAFKSHKDFLIKTVFYKNFLRVNKLNNKR